MRRLNSQAVVGFDYKASMSPVRPLLLGDVIILFLMEYLLASPYWYRRVVGFSDKIPHKPTYELYELLESMGYLGYGLSHRVDCTEFSSEGQTLFAICRELASVPPSLLHHDWHSEGHDALTVSSILL